MGAGSAFRGICLGILGIFFAAVLLAPSIVSAEAISTQATAGIEAIGLKVITGNVYLADGVTPVVSAGIVATTWNGASLRQTLFASTGPGGFYSVTFAPGDWDVGNFIVVAASNSVSAGEATVIADSSPTQNINVNLNYAVPEFSMPTFLVLGIVAIAFVLMGSRFRK